MGALMYRLFPCKIPLPKDANELKSPLDIFHPLLILERGVKWPSQQLK